MSIILSTPSLVKTSTWTDPGNLYISGKYATCTLSRRTTSGTLTIEYEDLNRYKIKEIYIRVHGKSSRSSCTVTLTDENNITLASSLSLSVNSDSVVKSSNLVDKINQDKVTINLTVYNGSYYSSNISIEGVSLEIVGEEIIEDEIPGIIYSKNMYLGDMPISELYLGNNSISELYLGNTLIYGTSKGVDIEGIVADGLSYYLDGRDFISGSNKWTPKIGTELVTFSPSNPSKLGNCVKLTTTSSGISDFAPFYKKTDTFTLEYYIKDIGTYSEYAILAGVGSNYHYFGIYTEFSTTTNASRTCVISADADYNEYYSTYSSSLHVQATCNAGTFYLYVDGELVQSTSNFFILDKTACLRLGNWEDTYSSPCNPTIGCFRYYDRALTKNELDKNRQFDLSIY